jgi:hypothetical protein
VGTAMYAQAQAQPQGRQATDGSARVASSPRPGTAAAQRRPRRRKRCLGPTVVMRGPSNRPGALARRAGQARCRGGRRWMSTSSG